MLDQPPVELRQSRSQGLVFLLEGVALLAVATGLFIKSGFRAEGMLAFVVGLVCTVLGAVLTRNPNRLILSPNSLSYVNLGIRRTWRWQDVSGFELTRVRNADVITFRVWGGKTDPTGRLNTLPSRWVVPAKTAIDLLNAARTKWG